MANLVPTSERRFPGAAQPELAGLLSSLVRDLDASGIVARLPPDRMPGPGARRMLERRLDDIEPWVSPAGMSDTFAEVVALFTGLRPRFADEDERTAQIELFCRDLQGIPRWALAAACQAYRQADVGDGVRMPTAGEVRVRARRSWGWLDQEADQIRAVLAARPGPPAATSTAESRASNLARVAAWKAEVKALEERASGRGMSPQEIARAKEIDASIEAGRPVPGRIPTFGPLARKAMSLPDPVPDPEMPPEPFDEGPSEDTWTTLRPPDPAGSERPSSPR